MKENIMSRWGKTEKMLAGAAAVLLIASVATGVASVTAGSEQSVNRTSAGVAIDGYDPVAYFASGAAIEGSEQYRVVVAGTVYYFVSAGNRDRFAADPEKFAPQYGGFCAYAVSRGYTAPIDPEAWKIVDGKLYLNYSKRVQRTWEEDVPGNVRKADANWVTLQRGRK
jgi:YHS domain-containing protein